MQAVPYKNLQAVWGVEMSYKGRLGALEAEKKAEVRQDNLLLHLLPWHIKSPAYIYAVSTQGFNFPTSFVSS